MVLFYANNCGGRGGGAVELMVLANKVSRRVRKQGLVSLSEFRSVGELSDL